MARLYSSSTFFSPLRMLHQWSVYFLTRNNKEIQCVGDALLIMLRSSSGFAWCQSAPPLSSSQSFILGFRCREGYPAQGLRVSSCLTLGSELSEEIHTHADRARALPGRGTWAESRSGDPGGRLCRGTRSLGFYRNGNISGLSLANHSDSGYFLVAHAAQPRWVPTSRVLGSWQDIQIGLSSLLLTFPRFFWQVVAC